jgi:hypothetical protein
MVAIVDFGPKRLTITDNATSQANHAPVGTLNGRIGSIKATPVVLTTPDFGPSSLTITMNGTTLSSGNPPMKTNFGMFGSGQLYTSTYVPPTPTWMSKVIIVM